MVEGTTLRGDNPSLAELPEAEGTHPQRVAYRVDGVVGGKQGQAVRTLQPRHRAPNLDRPARAGGERDSGER
ncbi:MAG: hypothetical protein KatS3mg061_2232 [Dehalococcoidia bacterium]|nr:MAG: hypothetical protein KatS3mg061_2232 [Dehalococcoidia bacterium]